MTRRAWVKSPDAPARLTGRKAMERRRRWLAAHPLCAACEAKGRVTLAAEVDHVVSLAKGGADNETNFRSLCVPCHRIKTAQDTGRRAADPPRRIGLDGYPIPGGK